MGAGAGAGIFASGILSGIAEGLIQRRNRKERMNELAVKAGTEQLAAIARDPQFVGSPEAIQDIMQAQANLMRDLIEPKQVGKERKAQGKSGKVNPMADFQEIMGGLWGKTYPEAQEQGQPGQPTPPAKHGPLISQELSTQRQQQAKQHEVEAEGQIRSRQAVETEKQKFELGQKEAEAERTRKRGALGQVTGLTPEQKQTAELGIEGVTVQPQPLDAFQVVTGVVDPQGNPNSTLLINKRTGEREWIAKGEKSKYTGMLKEELDAREILNDSHSTQVQRKGAQATLNKLEKPDQTTVMMNMFNRAAGTGKTGDAALEGQPEGIKNLVKKVAAYKMILPQGIAISRPPWSIVASLVPQYRPDWDEKRYPAAQAMMRDYTSGQTGKNIRSLNTLVQHLQTMETNAKGLSQHDPRAINMFVNAVRTGLGKPGVTNFETAKAAVADELSAALKGGAATDITIQHWREQFIQASSPAQIKGALDVAYDLMGGRLREIKEAYEGFVGETDVPIVYPSTKSVLSKRGIDPTKGPGLESTGDEKVDKYLKSLGYQ